MTLQPFLAIKGGFELKTDTFTYSVSHWLSWARKTYSAKPAVELSTSMISRDGEIGRRSGLKIRRGESSVGVRFPLPAPYILIVYADLSIFVLRPSSCLFLRLFGSVPNFVPTFGN